MPKTTLLDLLTTKDLKRYGGSTIFRRGREYYRQGRATVAFAQPTQAQCSVRGTRYYTVTLQLSQNQLNALCTCPHARGGWFCKHMVAAGLETAEYLEQYRTGLWKLDLDSLVTEFSRSTRRSNSPYWFFLSIQQNYQASWRVEPYRLWIDRIPSGVLPPVEQLKPSDLEELVLHNDWMLEHIKPILANSPPVAAYCINAQPEAIAFSRLLMQQSQQQNQQSSNYYYYSYTPPVYPMAQNLSLMSGLDVPIFIGDSHNPVKKSLMMLNAPAAFSLRMENRKDGIHLTPDLQLDGFEMVVEPSKMQLITEKDGAWYLLDRYLFEIDTPLPIETITGLLNRDEMFIPREAEDDFVANYFTKLAAHVPIEGENIEWQDIDAQPVARIYLTDEDGELQAHLRFGYDQSEVLYEKSLPEISVRRQADSWTLYRIHRQSEIEQDFWDKVSSAHHGLKRSGAGYGDYIFLLRARVHPIDFLMRHVPRLTQAGFEIYGEEKLKSARVNRNQPTLSLNVSSGIDWFDLEAVVKFGDVQATLNEVRRALKKKEKYVKLADGTIGEIPDEWIKRYRHLFGLGEQTDDGVRLSNHHLTLIDQLLADADRAQSDPEFDRRKKKLLDFEGIQAITLPSGFTGELRPYQKAGYDWLHFLHEYEFGGCLADDMGLGKTIETLVFLQSIRETEHTQAANLLVLPRSLLVNWERESARFTPDLKVYHHFGKDRSFDVLQFDQYDLILTTYGTMLRDIGKLRKYKFHYVILDESQAIKNPLAKTSKAARLLHSDHRLVLTGTPVENSTFELWSQFAFLNPGLLGNLEYFKEEFGNPIERLGDEDVSQFLRKMVYPFILRRTKLQVAPELPPRTERIVYSDMEPAQRKFYNKTRDYYRAMLLGVIEEEGMNNARMKVLEGLLRLRQISNHPRLVNEDFRGESSKFELLIETLETLQAEGHKALVFSQFVKMLTIVREELDKKNIPYVYLDGQTRKRHERVDTFQNDSEIPFFLISLKAGGVGLNLTAADYVIHIDPWWNPAVEMQATDRTHRIGQDKPVFVYKLITRGTVEEKILQLQDKKKALVEQLITTESSFFKSLTSEDVDVLFS